MSFFAVLLLLTAAKPAPAAPAATCQVPSGSYPTLQSAIDDPNNQGTVSLVNTHIVANTAAATGGAVGGGIYNLLGNMTVISTTVEGNLANCGMGSECDGGGINNSQFLTRKSSAAMGEGSAPGAEPFTWPIPSSPTMPGAASC